MILALKIMAFAVLLYFIVKRFNEIEKRKKQTKKKIHDGNERKDIQHWQE